MKKEPHICAVCHDNNNLVTEENGGAINHPVSKQTIAWVHETCKEEWGKKQGGSTYGGVKPLVEN